MTITCWQYEIIIKKGMGIEHQELSAFRKCNPYHSLYLAYSITTEYWG